MSFIGAFLLLFLTILFILRALASCALQFLLSTAARVILLLWLILALSSSEPLAGSISTLQISILWRAIGTAILSCSSQNFVNSVLTAGPDLRLTAVDIRHTHQIPSRHRPSFLPGSRSNGLRSSIKIPNTQRRYSPTIRARPYIMIYQNNYFCKLTTP